MINLSSGFQIAIAIFQDLIALDFLNAVAIFQDLIALDFLDAAVHP